MVASRTNGSPGCRRLPSTFRIEGDQVTAIWIDSWHMGEKLMISRGAVTRDGRISVHGSYAAPHGPDWGWRTVVEPSDGDSFRVIMYNVTPEGEEELAVEVNYARHPGRP